MYVYIYIYIYIYWASRGTCGRSPAAGPTPRPRGNITLCDNSHYKLYEHISNKEIYENTILTL